MATDFAALRERLFGGASERAWLDLWPAVVGARAALLQAAGSFSEEQTRWEPGAGEGEEAWCAFDLLKHVLAYSRNVIAIIEATAGGESAPKDPPGALAADSPATLDALREAILVQSVRLASLHEHLSEPPDLTVTVPHAFFGPLNSREWYFFLRIHDADHTAQLERIRANQRFPR